MTSMPPPSSPHFRNRILAALPPDESALIAEQLQFLTLERRQLIYDPERPIEQVCFVEHGIVSVLSVLADGSAIETATIGRDGMIGLPVFHGVDRTSEQAMVQVPGSGYMLRTAEFRRLIPALPTLSSLLHRFSVFMFTLAAQNSACNRKHAVEQRCARWLLTVHDHMDGDEIALTHDFVSQMLGVRRASVTDTLAVLEGRGVISTGRARITVVERAGLEAIACECYGYIRASNDRLFGEGAVESPLAGIETSRAGFSTVGDGTPMVPSLDVPLADLN